jgi:hypothetical protein
MTKNQIPFFHLDRYSSLPRPVAIPVPPHSGMKALLEAPLHDCDVKNSEAQGLSRADGHSEHKGSEWLQGWLDDTLPGQACGLGQGPFWMGI